MQISSESWSYAYDRARRLRSRIGVIALAVLAVGLLGRNWVRSTFTTSEPRALALALAQRNATLVRILGEPIRIGKPVLGSFSSDLLDGAGSAKLTVPLIGSIGRATMFVEATKNAGVWRLDAVSVHPDGQAGEIVLVPSGRDRRPSV